MKKAKKRKSPSARRRLPRPGSLLAGGVLTAVIGIVVLAIVYGATGGSGGVSDFVPAIIETRSESNGEPFEGGARVHFPVDSIDMGQVPLNTEVGYAFAMTNLGDAAARIEDVDVSIVEGC